MLKWTTVTCSWQLLNTDVMSSCFYLPHLTPFRRYICFSQAPLSSIVEVGNHYGGRYKLYATRCELYSHSPRLKVGQNYYTATIQWHRRCTCHGTMFLNECCQCDSGPPTFLQNILATRVVTLAYMPMCMLMPVVKSIKFSSIFKYILAMGRGYYIATHG